MTDAQRQDDTHRRERVRQSHMNLSQEQRDKISARLRLRSSDRNDHGQCLPLTAAALALDPTPDAGGQRLEALLAALGAERVVVPVVIDADTHGGQDTRREAGARKHAPVEFARCSTSSGPALAVYSCVDELRADRPTERPMSFDFRKVCLAALVETQGRICVDPAGAAVILPRPAVAACAQGDTWLPPWKDTQLLAELRQIVGLHRSAPATPSKPAVSEEGSVNGIIEVIPQWAGERGLQILLVVDASLADQSSVRTALKDTMEQLARCPRLQACADRVELVPLRR